MNNEQRENVTGAKITGADGTEFFEDTTEHVGKWWGFMPHMNGCKVQSATLTNVRGETKIDMSWVGTTEDLDSFITAGQITNLKAVITKIKLSEGALTLYNDL